MITFDIVDHVGWIRLGGSNLGAIALDDLDTLVASLRRATADASVQAVVIAGDTRHFSAGADLNLFARINTREKAVEISQCFQEAFGEIEDCTKPVAAALAGHVMGGALELAMACHYRVATPDARFSFPEVRLGVNPGAGGTQRLPRLVGLELALPMLLSAQTIGASQAQAAGLIDEICSPEDLLQTAGKLARQAGVTRRTCQREVRTGDGATTGAALAAAEAIIAKGPPQVIAPQKILAAVQAGVEKSLAEGLLAEREGFADCMGTAAAQNKIYLFFATRQAGKLAALAEVQTPNLERVGVMGAGTMGAGIAQALILANLPVVMIDPEPAALHRAVERIEGALCRRREQGRISEEQSQAMRGRLTATSDWQPVAQCDLVIEAAVEKVGIKREIFARLEEVCPATTVLATNTSTISLDELAASLKNPDRLVGMHFFNPAHRMPLVEVIRGRSSGNRALAATMHLARRLGKTAVLVNSREGFLVTRVFVPYLKEAFWLWQEGAEPAAIDEAMVAFGFPMGPLALIDMAGLDILAFTDRILREAFAWHGPLPPVAARLVESGQLGQKAGAGAYCYDGRDHRPRPNPQAEQIVAAVRAEAGVAPREFDREEVTERLVLRMASEAFYVLEEGLAQQPSDLDVAVVLGLGFPDFRGGILKYAEQIGHNQLLQKLEILAARCGERFTPSRWLRRQGALNVDGRPT